MPQTALAAVFEAPGRPFTVREIPLPVPAGGEVLVEVVACTLCGSDLHTIHGRRAVAVPTILGHEILGRMAAFGPEAPRLDAAGNRLRLGDRVTWGIVASCGDCFYCCRDLPQKCQRQTKYGHEALAPGRELTGGLADHCLLADGTTILRVPEELSDAAACPANCATATVAAALECAGPLAGRTVLVAGAGMLGVTACAWAKSRSAADVIACDVAPSRLHLAEVFGATRVAPPGEVAQSVADCTAGFGVDVAFELSGSPEAFESLLPLVRLGGTMVLIGSVFPSRPVPLLLEQLVRRCLTLRGSHNYAPRHLVAAIDYLAAHPALPFGALVSEWTPLPRVNEALSAPTPAEILRIGIRPAPR